MTEKWTNNIYIQDNFIEFIAEEIAQWFPTREYAFRVSEDRRQTFINNSERSPEICVNVDTIILVY